MFYRFCLVCMLSLFVLITPCRAGTPVWDEVGTSTAVRDITLMGNPQRFFAAATDPDGHVLKFQWRIASDPTGRANFDGDSGDRFVSVNFPWASSVISQNPVGASIFLEVTVNHADTAVDGDTPLTRQFEARITGVNRPPEGIIVVDPVSSPTNRIPEGEGVTFTSDTSIDPDNTGMRHEWTAQVVNGSFLQPLVFFGTEGTGSGFTIPGMSSSTGQISVTLTLLDGLHRVTTSTTVYVRKRDSSSTNGPPVISTTSPVNFQVGQQIALSATVTDSEDPCTFTWTFIQGSTTTMDPVISTVSGTAPYQWTVAGFHPALPVGAYQFKLRATENKTGGQFSEKTITVNVSQTGGGGGGSTPENGGAASWVPTNSGCTSPNGPPSISISPAANQFKPLYTGGSDVVLTVTATDTSEKENLANPGVKTSGATITFVDYSELEALGVNVQVGTLTKTSYTTSTRTISFTAPNTSATAHITFRAQDVFSCGTTVVFAIAFKPASANTPPTAVVKYRIDSGSLTIPAGVVPVSTNTGHTITLDGSASSDPGGGISSYLWTLTGATAGLQLTGATSAAASVSIPVGFTGTLTATLRVQDTAQVEDTEAVTFNFTTAAPTAPTARIRYKVGTSGTFQDTGGGPVTVGLSASENVIFDASTSTDPQGGALTYAWTRDTSGLTAGTANVFTGGSTSVSYTVNFSGNARGTAIINLTVKDTANETGTASVTVTLEGPPDQPPVARIKYRIGNGSLTADPPQPIENDSTQTVTLDGSTSSDAEAAIASYEWSLASPLTGVAFTGATTGSTATLTINEATLGTIEVRLKVKDSANQENTASLTFQVVEPPEIPALYFPQIGVGPSELIGQELKTVILLVNDTNKDANEVNIEFFDQSGAPMTPTVNGEAWANRPFDIKQMASQRFTFSNPEIRVGWARVTSDVKLFGMVQYQMFDLATDKLVREISLFASSPAKKVVTFFDPAEPMALAIANPGETPAKLLVKVVDAENGESTLTRWEVFPNLPAAGLGKNMQVAVPLPEDALPPYAKPGSLVIQSENDQDIVVTILKTTKTGEAFSTLPISIPR